MNSTRIAERLKSTMISFLDSLIEQIPNEGTIIMARIGLENHVTPQEAVNHCIITLVPLEERITERDETYFLEQCNLIPTTGDVNHLKSIWRSNVLTDNAKNTIWKWVDSFIYLTKLYQTMKKNE
jgi:hypothetical protein